MKMTKKEEEELKSIRDFLEKQDWWQKQPWITTQEDINCRKEQRRRTDNLVAIEDIWFRIGNGKMNLKILKQIETKSSLKAEIERLQEDNKFLREKSRKVMNSSG